MAIPVLPPPHPARNAQASAMVLGGMALMGLVDNFVATIAETTGLWQFQVIRSAMALALLAGVAAWRGLRLAPRRFWPVAARSGVLSTALVIYFWALAVLPVSEAVAGLFTAPLFVLLFGRLVFGHRPGPTRWAAALAGFAGVLLVLRPDGGSFGWMTAMPVVAGAFYGLAQLATREWCPREGALTLLAGFFVGMGVWGLLGLAVLWVLPQEAPAGAAGFALRLWGEMAGVAWAWTVAQAVFSLVAVGLVIRAYQLGEASHVAPFEYALLPFAMLWGFVLLGDTVDGAALAGLGLIVLSGGATSLLPVLRLRGAEGRPG